tara:strand:+ start:1352 stop:2311 length:960 start_codon:yes stop_codon:yes gene_type:complete
MKDKIAILAPGKGWGNFVSYISCFKKISEERKKKIVIITKKFSSAKSYLSDQNLVDNFVEIPDDTRGIVKKICSIIYIYNEIKKLNLNEIFIFHSSALYVLISYFAGVNKIYAPGIKYQNFFLKKDFKFYDNFKSKLIDPVEESKELIKKILKINYVPFKTLKFNEKIDDKKIAVCIACSGYEKQWGSENYIKLIKFLSSKGYTKFLILSGKDQFGIEEEIIKKSDMKLEFIKSSKKTISQVIPELKSCKLFIGNDTGFSHLATAYAKKTFVILGDCPPHTYSDLIIPIDKEDNSTRNSNSIKSISFEKVINIFNKNEN